MNRDAVILTLARLEARKAVKAGIQAAGLKLHQYSKAEIDTAAHEYLSGHRDELCAFVTSHYHNLVERLSAQPRRNRRKLRP
jgi:hypothetical protein